MTIDTFQFIKKSAALVGSLCLGQSSFADTVVMLSSASAQDRDQDGIAFLISGLTQANDQAYAPLRADQVTANIAFGVATSDLFRVEESSLLTLGSWSIASDLFVGDQMVSRVLSTIDQFFFDLSESTDRDMHRVGNQSSIDSLK
jgi:hypothetical protein